MFTPSPGPPTPEKPNIAASGRNGYNVHPGGSNRGGNKMVTSTTGTMPNDNTATAKQTSPSGGQPSNGISKLEMGVISCLDYWLLLFSQKTNKHTTRVLFVKYQSGDGCFVSFHVF